ncbi:hypothetical protein R50073_10790 [Maricurvus nonylphenolicus]|uniref:bifunctional diguanylate cyclase/phosphodiesterase n=1 Tax=Maricurvus nonylphenolicus TaxID=1008307 RepID=UPI0036F23C99
MNNFTQKKKLVFSFTLLLAVGFLTTLTIAYYSTKQRLADNIVEQHLTTTRIASAHLTHWLDQHLYSVAKFAKSIANSPDNPRDNPVLEFYMDQVTKAQELVFLAYALESDGYYASNDWDVPEDYAPRQRPWYQSSKTAMAPYITSPYFGPITQQWYIALTAPIIRDDKFIGVVSGDVTLNFIKQKILAHQLTDGSDIFVIDSDGHTVIHNDSSLTGKSIQSLMPGIKVDVITSFQEANGVLLEQGDVFYSIHPVEHTNWYLVVTTEKSSINSELSRQTINLFAIVLLVAILGVSGVLIYNRYILRPVFRFMAFDSNTGLPSKTTFKQQIVDNHLHKGKQGHLLIISINKYGQYTTLYSSSTMDSVLVAVKKHITETLPPHTELGKFSDGRFIAYIESNKTDSRQEVDIWLQRLAYHLSMPYKVEDNELILSFSIGASSYPQNGTTIDQLIDSAFSAIGQRGKNTLSSYHYVDPKDIEHRNHELAMLRALQKAIAMSELHMVYQPQVDSLTGKTVSLEALARWHSSELNRDVSPAEFIPLAEKSDLILLLGDWVINTVAQQVQTWNKNNIVYDCISINIAAEQLQQPNIVDRLLSSLARNQVSPQQIELEITETSLMQDTKTCLDTLQQLRSAGFRIAIDDFGTGYCSLEYLKMMPADKLKIDRAFIKDITHDNQDYEIAKLITNIAKTMNFDMVAEGVETEEQVSILNSLGCRFIQGYFFCKPMSATALANWNSENCIATETQH